MSISRAQDIERVRTEAEFAVDKLRLALLEGPDLASPSTLPGWSRAQLFAHLTAVYGALARQISVSLRSEKAPLYEGGTAGRNQQIAEIAALAKPELSERFGQATVSLMNELSLVTEDDLERETAFRGGAPLSEVLGAVSRETMIHLVDAEAGFRGSMLSLPFVRDLLEFLSARVPMPVRLVIQPLGMDSMVLVNPASEAESLNSIVVSGMLNDIALWLAGRTTDGQVAAQANADSVPLPELLPWPSALKD